MAPINRQETPRRPRAIKRDPDPSTNLASAGQSHTMAHGSVSNDSTNGAESSRMNVHESFYRNGRSNAPPPSDLCSEPEPLLREMRIRPNPVNMGSPLGNDESFSFHTSFQDIGKRLKACNDTLGELQGLGVSHDVPLPELVLVGDQSAGKSSVMSGLAKLDLPRSDGTCTRCPLHIRVSRNTDWSCRVSISKEYAYQPPQGRPITEGDVTDRDPFYPWKKLASTQVFEFKTVHDKNDIEEVLRWAQVAILNDDKPHDLFIPGSGATALNTPISQAAEDTSAKFSPNVVSLEIKGPELPNLSFYDMPGIFQNPADEGDAYLVNVVRNLSSSYIERPSAIIMCSMPMNTDPENSSTFGLTRKLNATERTIGVLTKADLLPTGNHSQWVTIMKHETHQTGLGYFITSRPKGKNLEDLRKLEESMFDNHHSNKWPEHFHEFGDRCGVEKLKEFLSNQLGQAFVRSLPQIEQKVRSHLEKIQRRLSNLPELPDNVELVIQRSLQKFSDSARANIDDFTRLFNALPNNFRDCLIHIKPKFILWDKSDIPVFEISDHDSDTESTRTVTPSKRRMAPPPQTPVKRQRGDASVTSVTGGSAGGSLVKPEDSDSAGLPSPSTRAPQTGPVLAPPFTEFNKVGSGFRTLAQVREEILRKTKAGMPNRTPDEVYEDLAMKSIKPWKGPMNAFLDETMRQLAKELSQSLQTSFDELKKRIVFKEAKKHLEAFLKAHIKNARDSITLLYADETHRLTTFNNEAFTRYYTEELILLTRFRHKMRMEKKYSMKSPPLEDWNTMSESKRRDDTRRREAELEKIGEDEFKREVDVIAYVRGYYKLAALRFADSVAQCIICRMIPGIKDEISFFLQEALGLHVKTSTAVYERLMEEDPAMAAERKMLKREREKFFKALTSINALNTGDADGLDDASVITAGDMNVEDSAFTDGAV